MSQDKMSLVKKSKVFDSWDFFLYKIVKLSIKDHRKQALNKILKMAWTCFHSTKI